MLRFSVLSLVLVFCFIGCKDIGTQLQSHAFSVNPVNVNITKGSTVQVTLSGGTIPYIVKTQPTTTIAAASLVSPTLTIAGVDSGRTFVVVSDSKLPVPDTIKISIVVMLPAPFSFASQIQPIFNGNCANCHITSSSGGLNLATGSSRNNLVDVQAQSNCIMLKRVLPSDATHSVLYLKLSSSSCGSQMPLVGSLSQAEINLIRDWINQGASNN
jgi:hypothetical protein